MPAGVRLSWRQVPPPPLEYRPQLDGLRALAIAVVLFAHFGPTKWAVNHYVAVGHLGVELFFILSGFLITRILLHDRDAIESSIISTSQAIALFYKRRTIRIFPTYYLALCYALIAGLGVMKSSIPWFAAYLTNFYIVKHGTPGSSTHLWSLAVEEQFYFIWPFAILILRRPAFVISAAFFIGITFRFAAAFPYGDLLLPSCLDYLAAGAALAFVFRHHPEAVPRLLRWSVAISIPAVIAGAIAAGADRQNFYRTAAAAISVWLIGHAALGISGPFGNILGNRGVRYCGRISYGLYLYHNFLPEGLLRASHFYHVPVTPAAVSLIALVLTFVLAAASWHFIELPLQNKRRKMN